MTSNSPVIENDNEYATRDIGEITYLFYCNLPFIETRPMGKISFFVFENRKNCFKKYTEYMDRKALVEPRAFLEYFQGVKDMIYVGL